jgi:hypothetical protein
MATGSPEIRLKPWLTPPRRTACGLAGWSNPWIAVGMRIATLGSRGFEPGPAAVEGGSLGHCQFDRKGRSATNGTCAVLVQGACRCVAPAFGSDRREGIQAGIEGRNPKRSRRDGQRSQVRGETVRRTGRHKQSGTPIFAVPAPGCAMVAEANSSRFSFCSATLPYKQRSDTSEANRSFRMP